MTAAGANAGATAAAMIAEATKASGVIVRVKPNALLDVIDRNDEPLCVHATGGLFTTMHYYLTSYRGLAFYAKASEPLTLPAHCEVVEAERIWIPG